MKNPNHLLEQTGNIRRLLSDWNTEDSIAPNFCEWRLLPSKLASTSEFPQDLHPVLDSTLRELGISSLYSHQLHCWESIKKGKNIIVISSTASGKSLCYQLPILDQTLKSPSSTSLLLFPTKALAQDQSTSLQRLIQGIYTHSPQDPDKKSGGHPDLLSAIYDGDTPSYVRPKIRKKVGLLISNPDMLHLGILPHHTAWARFFESLKFVVLDEAHIYRGVFGSHVANVIRRLKRIAAAYGAQPQFILTSATIANPIEFSTRLIGEEVICVDQDGSARGSKFFLIYNPPIVDKELGLRASALQESVRLAQALLLNDIQTIIFGRSRRSVELILTYLHQQTQLNQAANLLKNREIQTIEKQVRGYRSGYLPAQRRQIERELRNGEVKVIIATNALELGIDIGSLSASLMVGYPGSIAATWQQAGRAGRGDQESLSILVATAAPLDQFLASHPDYFFQRSPEHVLINPDNLLLLLDHIRCALFEMPFHFDEGFGNLDPQQLREFFTVLQEEGSLYISNDKFFWMADVYPAHRVSLRSLSASPINLQISGKQGLTSIGQIDQASANWMAHPKAIYLHEGEQYIVEDLDLNTKVATLRSCESDYYTIARTNTTVQLVERHSQIETQHEIKAYGEIKITSQVTGFHKIRWYSHQRLGTEELDMPATELLTFGYWFSLTEKTIELLRQSGVWTNDPNNYGPNWNRQRIKARERDLFCCKVCGIPEEEKSHHVHHINPFRSFSDYQKANQLDNLITLCPTCHRRVETAVRVRSGLAGLAYVLGQIAPFFLMCDRSDLGIHSDPKCPFTDGQPTIILYDQIPAGIGFSQHLFEIHEDLLPRAYELISNCKCTDGCPSCVGPGGELGQGSKIETLAILETIIGGR